MMMSLKMMKMINLFNQIKIFKPKETNINSQVIQPIQDQQNDSPRIQLEQDPIMIQIQQQIEAQAKKQSNQSQNKQNLESPSQPSIENEANRELVENQNEFEEEMILEKDTSKFNKQKNNYVEDYLNENSDSEDNMYGEEFFQNDAKEEEEEVGNQIQNDSDDLKFDNSDEEVNNLRQNGSLNGNTKFYSEKLQKLQMMNQQQNDAADDDDVFLSFNKQQNLNQANSQKSNGNLNTNQSTLSANNNSTIKIQTLDTSQSSMNKSNFTNNKTINQQQLVEEEQEQESDESDLDLYMKQLEEEENAAKGIQTSQKNSSSQNNTKPKQTYITMEDIFGKKKFKEDIEEEENEEGQSNNEDFGNQDSKNKVYFNGDSTFNQQKIQEEEEEGDQDEDDEEQDKFYQAFKEQLLKTKQEKLKDNKGALMMDEEQEKEEEREAFFDPENGESKEDYMERLKKEAQKKELKPIDYNEDELEHFQKNFYIESKEISQMTEDEVKIYRENLGEIQVKGQEVPRPIKSWLQSGLSDRILEVLIEKKKYDKPFPIQCQSLPVIMSGRDMIGIAETGSGKTLAYLLPMIRHVSAQRPLQEGDGPIGLILVPTRELATQIYLEAKPFLKAYKYEIVAVFGGTGIKGQLSELKRGCEIVVATPGRLIDVLTTSNGKITNLKRITMVVIDEADRMFDLGFEPQIAKILATTRPDKQTVLFSATFPKNVENLAKKLMRHKPVEVVVGARGQACTNITQLIEIRDESTRLFRLLELLGIYTEQGQVIIFVDKQIEVDFLYQELRSRYYIPTILHAGVDAEDRVNNLLDFRKGIYKILIATSLSSRGLDVKNVVLVVNYKCPNHIEDYIHRIGRTGRAGNKGTAVTFIGPEEDKYSLDLIKALKRSDQKVPEELLRMGEEFKKKVKMGEAKIYNNANMQGKGFNFDEEERDKMNQMKYEQKKFLALQMGLDIEERDDDFVFKKAQEESAKDKKDKDELTFQQKLHIVKTQDEYKDIREELFSKASEIANQKKLLGCGDDEIKKAIEDVFKKGLENFIPSTKNIDQGKIKIAKMLQEFEKSNDIANNICFEEIEINDYPENARKAVTKRDFQDRIYLQTGCLVVQKGIYVEIGKKVQPGFQKLYLRIEGDSEYQVRMAYRDIKAELEEKSIKIHERGGAQQGRFTIP
ncbi:DEAD/DEAH-box helicase (macronuclear) [Tetrahymena thermophila SB210]|uniref:RNA helicase n=1 Tax=Tetrahymena thermophila (strain SB210) TaxID=312017 RepID=I7M078_TETTS|nr:DEAD/DEAH-box helicase [Tetrahymena thermophila SB210]EAR85634.2 DEAD/DEAH-box helicase [Tetrahymena thermophila SB210]|eukprot:XP_001033297.2 DEAD/DEAH-box helicase [Tetrahymena thermophila SB210]